MGLTGASVGINAIGSALKRRSGDELTVALAGNPNVGKSTLFNALTGLKQHTGNWPGKTVVSAYGYAETEKHSYILADIPGTYSLMAHSAEEEVARDFICFDAPEITVVVCDATCLERNLNLVLQILEISEKTVVCVNLLDEAKRKNIHVDLKVLSELLRVPVIGTVARKKQTLTGLLNTLDRLASEEHTASPAFVNYGDTVEEAVAVLAPVLSPVLGEKLNSRWVALRLLADDSELIEKVSRCIGADIYSEPDICVALAQAREILKDGGIGIGKLKDLIAECPVITAHEISEKAVKSNKNGYSELDRKIDRLLTSAKTGYPLMLLLLAGVLWLTVIGANYPSRLLSAVFSYGHDALTALFTAVNAPEWLYGALVLGVYRVLSWVVSVMLPPMAIFFPLFTLLEDSGYLPRIAYNLDKPFKKCKACGKQALSMCMGFGCNAAGVVGCRIIDSPRERLIAVLTNSFVPCNGRFPMIITVITVFFVSAKGVKGSILSALILTSVLLLGIFATFAVSRLLSETLLKGIPSAFTLELPSYRRPQIGHVIVSSVFDRTIFVLGRAAAVAAPAGLIIWLAANVTVGDTTVLALCSEFLDPFARLFGMDGVILMAFILGFPANETVIPIIVMAYTAGGTIAELEGTAVLGELLSANGWTWVTAVNVILFSLFHWPCSTTVLTVHRETRSLKWTAVAVVLPTLAGMLLCFLFTTAVRIFL